MNDRMKSVIRFSAVLLITVISLNWIYPFSPLSMSKSFTYNADNVIVKQYQTKLNEVKRMYNPKNNNKPDRTRDRIQYLLPLYEQNWLQEKEPQKLSYEDLESMLMEVQETREILIELTFYEDYTIETKEYLKSLLVTSINIEESITLLKHSNFQTRLDLKRQYRNLYIEYMKNLDLLKSFYQSYIFDSR